MKSNPPDGSLPQYIKPFELAQRGASLEGSYSLDEMTRLKEMVSQSKGEMISFHLEFKRDEDGRSIISGEINAFLTLLCQRCSNPVTLHLQLHPHLTVVLSDAEAAQLLKKHDPLVTYGKPVHLLHFIEDELLLALPMIPKHQPGECALTSSDLC